jgi:hypothetical protein
MCSLCAVRAAWLAVCSPRRRRLTLSLSKTGPLRVRVSAGARDRPTGTGRSATVTSYFQSGAAPVYRSRTVPALKVLRPILAGICGRPRFRRRVSVNETFELLSRTPSRRVRVGLRQYSPCITSSEQIHRRRRLAVAAADRYTYPE